MDIILPSLFLSRSKKHSYLLTICVSKRILYIGRTRENMNMFASENEEKRSQLWRVTVVVATLLIISIGSYTLHKMFTENPISGTWVSQTRDLTLMIEEEGIIHIYGELDMQETEVSYSMDKANKQVSFTLILDEGYLKEDTIEEDDMKFTSTYTYSVDQEFLSLTDVEFGDVEYFIKEN